MRTDTNRCLLHEDAIRSAPTYNRRSLSITSSQISTAPERSLDNAELPRPRPRELVLIRLPYPTSAHQRHAHTLTLYKGVGEREGGGDVKE